MAKPKIPENQIRLVSDNDNTTTVFGDPKAAKTTAKSCLNVIDQFSKAVFKGDIETAYGLCANELRSWMSIKRFVTTLRKADAEFDGAAVDWAVEYVAAIWADEASRVHTSSEGWPKDTPKLNRRGTVCAFWFTNKEKNEGRWAFFYVTEEAEGFRIAKFNQYLQ